MRLIKGNFKGGNYPIGTKVQFWTKSGSKEGTVENLLLNTARVLTSDKTYWKVPYQSLKTEENIKNAIEMPLHEIENLGISLLKKYNLEDWRFGFDLAKTRGGVCKYGSKTITLSVTFCLKSSKKEILNTILHEIAHALAGYKAGHGPVWRKIAKSIGCSGDRCHTIKHTEPRWVGSCSCFSSWKRYKLTKKVRDGICSNCKDSIQWKWREN